MGKVYQMMALLLAGSTEMCRTSAYCLFFNYSTQTPPITYGPNPDNIPSPCLKQETAMEIWVIENTQELIWVYEQIMNKLLSISDSQLEYIPKYKIPDYIV